MSPRNELQNEKIREERKQQIMAVALEVLAEKGLSKASIASIAARAEISKGLMYNYFSSKEELVIQILIAGFEELTETLDADPGKTLTSEALHRFIDHTFDTLEKKLRFWRMYFMVLLQPDVYTIIAPHLESITQPFFKIAYHYFEEQGYEAPEAEVRLLAAILDGVGLHFIMDPHHYPLHNVKKRIHQIFQLPDHQQLK